jgi:adenylylsulfate kinase-like enzyme
MSHTEHGETGDFAVIVQLAGLPGSGKSTLASELVCRLGRRALLLDKDQVRNTLFGPEHTIYTRRRTTFAWSRCCVPRHGSFATHPAVS